MGVSEGARNSRLATSRHSMGEKHSAEGARRWTDTVVVGFVSVCYLGYAPVASGTFGSMPGVLVAWWLNKQPVALTLLAIVLFGVGVAASTRAESIFVQHDPSRVTIDEFVGMLVAFIGLPMTWTSVVLVFVFYRILDVVKPFPARQCEKIGGGLGIMADDVVAGIYANLACRVLMAFIGDAAL